MKQLSFFLRSNSANQPAPRRGPAAPARRRLSFLHITCFFLFWVTAICCRLVWLQVVRHSEFMERAAKQQQRTFEVAPRRGILYDRDLHELAVTVLATSVYAVPLEIAGKHDPDARAKYQAAADALAGVVHSDPADKYTSARRIAARLNASRDFAWVARKLDPQVIARVKALNLKGVYFQKEFKRYYPNNQLAAQVLGYVGTDDNGLGGVESEFNHDLRGVPGRMLTALDARRHVLGSEERDPEPGENLVLTIDENIQFIVERALDAALERTHALNGVAVVQDPNTGQILALAIRPTFNPNDFRHTARSLLRDHAVNDVYEPGSTFKLVTYSAALEQKVTNPNEVIDCQGGKIELAGRIIHDDHPNGLLTTTQALWESSDVAAVKLALRMGPETFYKYIRAYGFGSRSGIELPGETRGLLRNPKHWQGSSIGSIAMGQEIAVTPIQLVTMASTLANGGIYLPPRIVKDETRGTPADGQLKPAAFHPETDPPDPLPPGAHRVVSAMTAAEMRKLLEGVVLHGTGKNAQLNGYSAGGKTGTAQKIDVLTHRYSKTQHIASFVGFAPVNNPAITVVVVLDSPHGDYYAAASAAPVFRDIAQQVLEYLGIPHDEEIREQAPLVETKQRMEPPPQSTPEDLEALFAAVNELPADDPLRAPANGSQMAPVSAVDLNTATNAPDEERKPSGLYAPAPASAARPDSAKPDSPDSMMAAVPREAPQTSLPSTPAATQPAHLGGMIVVDAQRRIAVPAFVGKPLREAVENAGTAGLRLEILGSGIAREQAPPPGTMVPLGTGIVVHFTR